MRKEGAYQALPFLLDLISFDVVIGIRSYSLDPFLPVIFGGNTKHCHWKLCT